MAGGNQMNSSNEVKIQDGKVFIDDKEIKNLKSIYIRDDDKGIDINVHFTSKPVNDEQ